MLYFFCGLSCSIFNDSKWLRWRLRGWEAHSLLAEEPIMSMWVHVKGLAISDSHGLHVDRPKLIAHTWNVWLYAPATWNQWHVQFHVSCLLKRAQLRSARKTEPRPNGSFIDWVQMPAGQNHRCAHCVFYWLTMRWWAERATANSHWFNPLQEIKSFSPKACGRASVSPNEGQNRFQCCTGLVWDNKPVATRLTISPETTWRKQVRQWIFGAATQKWRNAAWRLCLHWTRSWRASRSFQWGRFRWSTTGDSSVQTGSILHHMGRTILA